MQSSKRLGWFGLLVAMGMLAAPRPAMAQWATSGNNIFNTNLGSIGVGTSIPRNILEVNGIGAFTNWESFAGAGPAAVRIGYDNGNDWGVIHVYNRSTTTYKSLLTNSSDFRFLTSGTEKMRLTTTGLGIGTSSPSQKLEVAGGIKMNSGSQPSCTSALRGTMWFTAGVGYSGSTAKDSMVVCAQDVGGSSAWRTIY